MTTNSIASFDVPAIAKEAVAKVIVPLLREYMEFEIKQVENIVQAYLTYLANVGKPNSVNHGAKLLEDLLEQYEPDPKVRGWIMKTSHYRESLDAIRQTVCDAYQKQMRT